MQFSREMVASRDTVFADHGPQQCSHCITTTEQFWRVSQTARGISDQLTGHTCSGRVAWRGEAWRGSYVNTTNAGRTTLGDDDGTTGSLAR